MTKFRYIGDRPEFTFHGEYKVGNDLVVTDNAGGLWEFSADGFALDFEPIEMTKGTEEMTETKKAPPTALFTKADLLDAAKLAVGDRGLNYGRPEDNFARIAAHWNAFLANRGIVIPGGGLVSASDVAIMCALLKIARLENDPGHHDSWVDLAGYAACGAEIELSK
ncbi:DUF6378 domain-containing protein [Patescibacteria group bacterium]|jgi:hypothetical protein|nr:DUF6378 domain-containing protein [Patescibacteria group bacterium]